MTFASDNWVGASDPVMAALAEANAGSAPAYGNDTFTGRANDLLSAFFERDVAAFFVATGSAANSLAVSTFSRPGGVALCHEDAHLVRDEAGAAGLFGAGLAIDTVDGPGGRIDQDALQARLESYREGNVHQGRPVALSLTNVNEFGLCYDPGTVAALASIAKRRGLAVHLDGARFFNALAHTGSSPAELTWRAGVDAISLGFTKTGAWCAEVLVFFDMALREDAAYRQKQAAQLFSKNRFVAAQVAALLEGNHALALASHANTMATEVADILAGCEESALAHRSQSNEVFAYLSASAARKLAAAKITAHPWSVRSAHAPKPPQEGWTLHRLVASYRTSPDDVQALRQALAD
ncbi:MAG: beta-eliminating lyase-related protein [Pseudomonadota bacterium]